MDEFLRQMRAAVALNLYFPALLQAVTLPDICAALEAANGETSESKYKRWVENYLEKWSSPGSAKRLYAFRCALVHQGRVRRERDPRRLVFAPPGAAEQYGDFAVDDGAKHPIDVVSIRDFCTDMDGAVKRWWVVVRDQTDFRRNYATFVRPRPFDLGGLFAEPVNFLA